MEQQQNVSWVRGKCIGSGSFGAVNLAFHRSNGAVFAVKSVDRSACLPHQLESLENEISILRSLSSPFVVQFLGDDDTGTRRNMHVGYMPGGTIADVAARGGDLDERCVRFYTLCLASALSYVHGRGIVHCDVKGRNVLVGPTCAKLADFGSAVELSIVAESARISPRGSPLWMAPEVVRGESQGPESDVWSLGCTVVEMVTGKPAWDDSGADTLSRIGYSDELPAIPTRLSELGRDFLDKCLRRDPRQRWSCDQLLQHPFLTSVSASSAPSISAMDSSPRCVLDWIDSEFEQIDEDDDVSVSVSAKERIGKLVEKGGSNWKFESDGWVTVRTRADEVEGTFVEFQDSSGAEEETESQRANWEHWNYDNGEMELGFYRCCYFLVPILVFHCYHHNHFFTHKCNAFAYLHSFLLQLFIKKNLLHIIYRYT